MPRSEGAKYVRFAAVLEWRLIVSFNDSYTLGDTKFEEKMNAEFILSPVPTGNQHFAWTEWWAQQAAGKATYEMEYSDGETVICKGESFSPFDKFEKNDLPIFARLAVSSLGGGTYDIMWSGIDTKGTRNGAEVGAIVGFGGFGDIKLPKGGVAIQGQGEGFTWSLVPVKEMVYMDIELKLQLFIPAPIVNLEGTRGPIAVHGGDGRENFSYSDGTHRAMQKGVVSLDPRRDSPIVSGPDYEFGITTTYSHAPIHPVPGKPWWWWELDRGWSSDRAEKTQLKRTEENCRVSVDDYSSPHVVGVSFHGEATIPSTVYPAALSPAIDWDFLVDLGLHEDDHQVYYQVKGAHDGFPAYELYLNGKRIYEYDPVKADNSPRALYPPVDIEIPYKKPKPIP